MQAKSHKVGGVCAATVTTAVMIGLPNTWEKIAATAVILVASEVGSLLPDIDHPNSRISRKNPILALGVNAGLAISKFITSIFLLLCFWIPKRRKEEFLKGFEHRGIFHTIAMVVLIYLFLGLLHAKYAQTALCAGYVSHLLMDMLTVSGVKLFYPFINKSLHLIPGVHLHTGNKPHEMIARVIFILLTVIIILLLNSYGMIKVG